MISNGLQIELPQNLNVRMGERLDSTTKLGWVVKMRSTHKEQVFDT